MEKKEFIRASHRASRWLTGIALTILGVLSANAQEVGHVEFCDKSYSYETGKDSVTLYMRLTDNDGQRIKELTLNSLNSYLLVREDGKLINADRSVIQLLNSGQRIPSDYTFSVLVDLNVPQDGKEQLYEAVRSLVESTPDSCVYLSFFGETVSSSELVTKQNFKDMKERFMETAEHKFFFSAIYAKLTEFSQQRAKNEDDIRTANDYKRNKAIADRAQVNKDKNILFVLTEGKKGPDISNDLINYLMIDKYQATDSAIIPRVYAYYYTADGISDDVIRTLECIAEPMIDGKPVEGRQGVYKKTTSLNELTADFEEAVQEHMYDIAFIYQAMDDKSYMGNVTYTAEWNGKELGNAVFSIGSVETPWPERKESAGGATLKYIIAVLVLLLTSLFFFLVIKVLVPLTKEKFFAIKYYKKYVPEPHVQHRICHFCKQEIFPGQTIVAKCSHLMHIDCWKQNGYKCSEYGQNCKTGYQEHVEWKDLFSLSTLRESRLTIECICSGFVSWLIFELTGRGMFHGMGRAIAHLFLTDSQMNEGVVNKVSAFLTIGLLLGFFLSLVLRNNDEYRKKDWNIYLKIVGLSVVSGLIGMAAFAIGANIYCMLLSVVGTDAWYCSLPAYLLFSVCVSLSLIIKSSISAKDAMIGGLCSALIGFIVLYFSSFMSYRYPWMNMLLDFIIYGGGLGASLVTVRMLADRYFLVIQNGAKAGQRIPIHKWMSATGGGNKVSIGMTRDCEIQMNWEKSNKVAKEHAQLYLDPVKRLPMLKPLAKGVFYNVRVDLPVMRAVVLSNGDTFKIGDTIFKYEETE